MQFRKTFKFLECITKSVAMALLKLLDRIPFKLSLFSMALFVSWDYLYTYIVLASNPNAYEGNPVNAFFVNIFGKEYFIFGLPIVLLFLYSACVAGAKIAAKLDKVDELQVRKQIALSIALLDTPNIINQLLAMLLNTRLLKEPWQVAVLGIGLFLIFTIALELERMRKNN